MLEMSVIRRLADKSEYINICCKLLNLQIVSLDELKSGRKKEEKKKQREK